MSPIIVEWTGQCSNSETRARLLKHLQRLAELSDKFLRVRAELGQGGGLRERDFNDNVEQVSLSLPDEVLVSSRLLPEEPSLQSPSKAKTRETRTPPADQLTITGLRDAGLTGIDFGLFAPHDSGLDPHRLSVVFVEAQNLPLLDGRLVRLTSELAKSLPEGAIPPQSCLCLAAPSIALHRDLEDWINLLFSWMKFFFIGDLSWRLGDELQDDEDYRDVFFDVQTTLGADRAEQTTYDAILATFAQHAEQWGDATEADQRRSESGDLERNPS